MTAMERDRQRAFGPYLGADGRDCLQIDGCDVGELVDRFGAPLWIISERTIRHNYRALRDAFTGIYPKTRIAYASKANPEPSIVRIVHSEGALVDAVTMGHIRLLLAAGVPPRDIVFNGNAKTVDELRWATTAPVGVLNVDSIAEMELLAAMQPADAPVLKVCVRLAADPELFDAEYGAVVANSKFGMSESDALVAARLASEHPALALSGIHHHIGWTAYGTPYSVELDLERHRQAVGQVLDFARVLAQRLGAPPQILNLGGGFRVGRAEGFGPGRIAEAPSPAQYADAVAGTVVHALRDGALGEPQITLEPGGYLVADAAVLVASVGSAKRLPGPSGGTSWVFVENTSGYHFARRVIHGFAHHVVAVRQVSAQGGKRVSLAGPVCSDDSLARDVRLPVLARGDLLAFLDQGAYCEAVTSDFCAVPIPAAVLACDSRAEIVRRRETSDDLVARFAVPSWLAQPSA